MQWIPIHNPAEIYRTKRDKKLRPLKSSQSFNVIRSSSNISNSLIGIPELSQELHLTKDGRRRRRRSKQSGSTPKLYGNGSTISSKGYGSTFHISKDENNDERNEHNFPFSRSLSYSGRMHLSPYKNERSRRERLEQRHRRDEERTNLTFKTMYRNKKDAKSKSKVDTCPDNLDKRDRSKYKSNVDDTNTNNTNTNKKNDYNNESDNNNNATNKADEKEKEEKDVIIDVKSSGTHEIETSYQSTVSVSASSSPFRAEYRLASASFRGTASRTSRSSSPPPPSLFTIMSFLSASIFGTSSRYRTIRNTDDNTHSSSSLNHHNTNNVYSRHKAEKKNEFLVDALIKVVCVSIFLFSVGLLVHFVYVTLPALSANSYLAPNASAVFSPGTLIGPAAALASDSRTSTHSSSSTSSRSDSAHSTSLSEAGIAEATCTQNGFLYPPDLRGTWQSVDSEGVHGYFSISERNDKITTKLATIPSVAHSSSHRRELTREDSIATLSSTTASTSPPLPTSLSYSSLLTNSVDTVVFDHLPEFAVPATNAYITQFGGNGDFVDTSVNANYNEALQRRRQQLLTFYKVEECAVVDNKVYQRCMLVRLNPLAPSSSSPSLSVFVYSDAKLQHKCPTIDTGSAALDQSLMMGVG